MKLRRLTHFASRIALSNMRELNLPYRLTYTVTNHCQARCAMCNIWQKPMQNELNLTEIEALFQHANHFSWINLSGGELFQRPDIQHIFRTIIHRSNKLYLLNFPTNGFQTGDIISTVDMILHETRLPRLIVSVSIDGSQELHDKIRGIDGSWKNALETFRLLRLRRSSRFSVYLGHTLQATNLGRFDEMVASCNIELGGITPDDFHINLAHTSGHYYDNTDTEALPDPELALREIERIATQRKHNTVDPVTFIEQRYQRYSKHYLVHGKGVYLCQAAAASCFIDAAGIVYPCSVFDSPIGDLRMYDMNFKTLWLSEARKSIRRNIISNNCPGCWTPCEAYQTILANLFEHNPS